MSKRPADAESEGGKEVPQNNKRIRIDYESIVAVLFGPEEKTFLVHKDAICSKSKFFTAACSDRWVKGTDKTIRLPEQDAATFETYTDWIYTHELADPKCTSRPLEKDDYLTISDGYIKLYCLAGFLGDWKLLSCVIDLLIHVIDEARREFSIMLLNPAQLHFIYEHTAVDSHLRKVAVAATVQILSAKTFANGADRRPPEFMRDAAVEAMQVLQARPKDIKKEKAKYHEPEDDAKNA